MGCVTTRSRYAPQPTVADLRTSDDRPIRRDQSMPRVPVGRRSYRSRCAEDPGGAVRHCAQLAVDRPTGAVGGAIASSKHQRSLRGVRGRVGRRRTTVVVPERIEEPRARRAQSRVRRSGDAHVGTACRQPGRVTTFVIGRTCRRRSLGHASRGRRGGHAAACRLRGEMAAEVPAVRTGTPDGGARGPP